MGLFSKLSNLESAMQLAERVLKWAPWLAGWGLSSWASGWALSATTALAMYSPFSWVFGALLGGLLFALAALAWSAATERIARRDIALQLMASRAPSAINPLDDVFTKQRVSLEAFRPPYPANVVGKTFVDCDLVGPAVILMTGNINIDNPKGFINCDFAPVVVGRPTNNAVIFRDITLRRCTLIGVTILVQDNGVALFNQRVRNMVWLSP